MASGKVADLVETKDANGLVTNVSFKCIPEPYLCYYITESRKTLYVYTNELLSPLPETIPNETTFHEFNSTNSTTNVEPIELELFTE